MVLELGSKEQIIYQLRNYGFALIHNHWTKEKCEQGLAELKSIPSHLFEKSQGGDLRVQHSNKYCSTANDFLHDSFIQEIANEYSECNVAQRVLGGIVPFVPGQATDSGGGWHVDCERENQLKAFMYLHDVNSDNGPFLFVQKSKELSKDLPKYDNLRISEETIAERVNPEDIIEMVSPAGTCILADSTYIHRGKQIESGTRYTYTTYFYER